MTMSFLRRFLPISVALAAIPACNLMCPYNADQVFETQVRAECHFYFACCTVGEHDVLEALPLGAGFADMARFRDEGNCVQERLEEGSEANELFRAIVQAEQAGRFQYDVAKSQVCAEGRIAALNNCDADFLLGDKGPLETSEECTIDPEAAGGDGTAGIQGKGTVKSDGGCFFDFECALENSRCLPRTVLDSLDDFDSCAVDDDCRNGEFCDEGLCVLELEEVVIADDKICIPPFLEGDDCSPDDNFPALPSFCEAGARCMPNKDGNLSCELPLRAGDQCFGGTADCERGLFCDNSTSPAECTELKGQGDDCNSSDECELGLFCDLSRNEPSCEAALPVDVQICTGIVGGEDRVYDVPAR